MNNRKSQSPAVSGGTAVPTFLPTAVELLRRAIAMAEKELKQFVAEGKDDLRVRNAEAVLQVAEANWQAAWDVNKRMPGIISPAELERLRLTAEVARLRLDRARAANVQSALNHVQSELRKLAEKVHRLRDRVDMFSARN